MADVGIHTASGPGLSIIGVDGVNDNDIVMEVSDAEPYDEFFLGTLLGIVDVDVSLDGTNFIAAIALNDESSLTPATKVVVTAAAGLYSFRGNFKVVRVRQNTAVDATEPAMICRRRR